MGSSAELDRGGIAAGEAAGGIDDSAAAAALSGAEAAEAVDDEEGIEQRGQEGGEENDEEEEAFGGNGPMTSGGFNDSVSEPPVQSGAAGADVDLQEGVAVELGDGEEGEDAFDQTCSSEISWRIS